MGFGIQSSTEEKKKSSHYRTVGLVKSVVFPSLGCPKSMTMNFWFSVIFVRFYLHHFCRRRLVSRVFGGDDAKPAEISFYLFSKRFSRHISIFSSHLLTANFASSLSIAASYQTSQVKPRSC